MPSGRTTGWTPGAKSPRIDVRPAASGEAVGSPQVTPPSDEACVEISFVRKSL